MKPLAGKVAVVAGAARGAGRGIASMLGEAGATVYCTGRSSRAQPNRSDHYCAGRPETIEETAELVSAAGGKGIPVRVDHNDEKEVRALFARVKREQGHLDVLANLLTGRPASEFEPFWKQSVEAGRAFVDSWIWSHVMTCRHAVPLMMQHKSGLIVEVIEGDSIEYRGHLYLDLAMIALKRLAYGLAQELAGDGITALAVTPGFMRTEYALEMFGVTEANWRDAADRNPQARSFGWLGSESPSYIGRGVAALAADPYVLGKSGGIFGSWTLADEYGFTDLDGTSPESGRRFSESPGGTFGAEHTHLRWRVTADEAVHV